MYYRDTPNDRESLRLFDKLKGDAEDIGITVEITDRGFMLVDANGAWIASHDNLDYLEGVLRGVKWSREQHKDMKQGEH